MTCVSQTIVRTYSLAVVADSHAKKHVYAIITNTGEHLEAGDSPTTRTGIKRAISWGGRGTGGNANSLWTVEGTASCGAVLTWTVTDAEYKITGSPGGYAKTGHGVGKTIHWTVSAWLPLPCPWTPGSYVFDG